MIEIKFRAWDKTDSEMVGVDLIVFNDKTTTDKAHILDERNDVHYLNEIVLMQYTGLKDKNGVDIYEGDIVAYDLGFDDEKTENYKIVFDNKQCAYFMFPLNDKSRLRHFTYSAKNDCEVIGNIYENSELLN